MPKALKNTSVLDLPLKKQKELAKLCNQSLEDWQETTRRNIEEADEYAEVLNNNPPFEFSSSERESEVRARHESEEFGFARFD